MRLLAILFVLSLFQPAHADTTRIVVFGDMPYDQKPATLAAFEGLISSINAAKSDLVIHVGDTKSGSSPCTDDALGAALPVLQRFHAPALYTPGDNEWTDCHRAIAGKYDPRERLTYLREIYFNERRYSFGQRKLSVTTQAARGYPENMRLRANNIGVITAHVVGSQNNMNARAGNMAEFIAREQAVMRWLRESFAAMVDAEAIVVALHANMFFLGYSEQLERFIGRSPYGPISNTLVRAAREFGKPVLLVHGDTHVFRAYQPFRKRAPNITAIETYGAYNIRALSIDMDPQSNQPYRIRVLAPWLTDR